MWEWVADRNADGWGVVRGGSLPRHRLGPARLPRAARRPSRATTTTGFRIVIDSHTGGGRRRNQTAVPEPRREAIVTRAVLIDALREVYDPCCADRGISIVDMGVVEDVRVDGSHVEVDLVLTTGWCPFVATMSTAIPER